MFFEFLNSFPALRFPFLLGQTETGTTFRSVEFDGPTSDWEYALVFFGVLALISFVIWLYRKDTHELSLGWRLFLGSLRIAVIACLVVIALNPQERIQRRSFRPSRVAVLVDTSSSMKNPSEDRTNANAEIPSREEVVLELLAESKFIAELRKNHEVAVYTFAEQLKGPLVTFPSLDPRYRSLLARQGRTGEASSEDDSGDGEDTSNATEPAKVVDQVDWRKIINAEGTETRLGDAVSQLLTKIAGRNLAGVITISDGASNAGAKPSQSSQMAAEAKTKLVSVGVGGLQDPANIEVVKVLAPSDVQLGDAFDLTAYIQGRSVIGKRVEVVLSVKDQDDTAADPVELERREITIEEDGVPQDVVFSLTPQFQGRVVYQITATPVTQILELRETDNQRTSIIDIFDRPTKVLVIAGGPHWDYRFLRNMLYRHRSIELDVWLQSGSTGMSQEADELLYDFPDDKAALFEYDVIIGFDPDWSIVRKQSREELAEWVLTQGGGLILVGGNVFMPDIALDPIEYDNIHALYPIVPETLLIVDESELQADQVWPLKLTDEGLQAEFMQLADDPLETTNAWASFSGIYWSYPTAAIKAAATVYAYMDDPRLIQGTDQPVFLAGQYYGKGRTFLIGSAELFRLRAENEQYFDRFWIKLIRTVGQGRLRRGASHGSFLLEGTQFALGRTIPLRVHVVDAQYEPSTADLVELEITLPNGKPLIPNPKLKADPQREGDFIGAIRADQPGRYQLALPIEELNERAEQTIEVLVPRLEEEDLKQNIKVLRELTEENNGLYVPIARAEEEVPVALVNRGEEITIAEQLRTLWDRQWLMFLLAGLLSCEWLTRKLLRLA